MDLISQYKAILSAWKDKFKVLGRSISVEKLQTQSRLILSYAGLDQSEATHESPSHIVLDIGSGAGFPGIFWAIDGVRNIHMVERSFNRYSFLDFTISELGLHQVFAHNADIASFKIQAYATDISKKSNLIIAAQAFKDVTTLLLLTSHLLYLEPTIVLLKNSHNATVELKSAQEYFKFDYDTEQTEHGLLVRIFNISRL